MACSTIRPVLWPSCTIIPWLFDAAKAKDAQPFKPEGGVWEVLRNDPDRYIHASVRHGVDPALMEKDALTPGPSPGGPGGRGET